MPETMTRKEAQKQGLREYFTGAPCKYGHIAYRQIISSNCKECARIYQLEYNYPGGNNYYSKLSKEERSKLCKKRNREFRERNREAWLRHKHGWRQRNNGKVRAHRAVERAIKVGTLIKKVCGICGQKETIGHHDDYNQQLVVRWLC